MPTAQVPPENDEEQSDEGGDSDVHPDPAREPGTDDDEPEEISEDPNTGSTKPDPTEKTTGLPPAGQDPMAGEAPSG